mmetsp:Transcript_109639/g.236061  ORF Transcript_109639/g.236061 Transcript_109639/m.236061 type:complete len:254 (+) Transcript_109639:1-762(+)
MLAMAQMKPGQQKEVVQQALLKQQQTVAVQREQFTGHVKGISQLLEAQAVGLVQSQVQVKELLEEILPQAPQVAGNPRVQERMQRLSATQGQVGAVHGLLRSQLAKLHKAEVQAQEMQLQTSQGQVGSLFQLLQAQSAQLQAMQQQVTQLTTFGQQAKMFVENATRSADARMRSTQAQVENLQVQLESTLATQEQLQAQLRQEPPRGSAEASRSDADADQLKLRIAVLEAELSAFLRPEGKTGSDEDDDDEWV